MQEMVSKMKNQLARQYNVEINDPNMIEVRDILQQNWNDLKINQNENQQLVVCILNSRARKDALTKKYEMVKYKCFTAGKIPNQVILTKTCEQHDFLKLVVLNLMYDFILKLPDQIGHKLYLEDDIGQWLNNQTMVFAVDYENRKGCKNVCAILH